MVKFVTPNAAVSTIPAPAAKPSPRSDGFRWITVGAPGQDDDLDTTFEKVWAGYLVRISQA